MQFRAPEITDLQRVTNMTYEQLILKLNPYFCL